MSRLSCVAGLSVSALLAHSAFGQAVENLKFEVASVKPSLPVPENAHVYFGPPRGGPGTSDPGQITWTYATMKGLLMTAYDAKAYQINGPDWLSSERYDIVVKVPEGTTKAQVEVMWQSLLAERFGLAIHHESREFNVEELVVAPDGPRLKETAEDLTAPLPQGPPKMKNGELISPGIVSILYPDAIPKAHTVARAQSVSQLAGMLSNQLNIPVLDKTGLTGKYDFTLDYTISGPPTALLPPTPPAPAATPGGDTAPSNPVPDLAAVVQQQLGLRLVAGRANLDVIVIDKVDKVPAAN